MGKLYNNSLSFVNDWKEPTNDDIIKSRLESKKISVVIPVYHPRYLKEVLMHLSKLEFIYEVITVFDSHDDNSNLIIDDYKFKLLIT